MVPLIAPGDRPVGGLCLVRGDAWVAGEMVIAERLTDCFAHAWLALEGRRQITEPRRLAKVLASVAGVGLFAVMMVPIHLTALAPAEVVGADATTVTAPMDGVIRAFNVEPSQPVSAGEILFTFDETELRAARDVAERTLAVAEAEHRRASQGAFVDREASQELAILESQIALRQAELDYAVEQLDRVAVRADRDGVAVFADADDWAGRPVVTGERILQIADPDEVELDIHLGVGDALVVETGAPVELFLDIAPLEPLTGQVIRASYEATPRPDGTLAYLMKADLTTGGEPPRIGLRGTASIQGDRVPLYYYLFRRPIAVIRQTIGY